ncbi:MAG: hypothetical protein IIB00_02985 [candidate division Zixibacteria bacterium]|nr:hypothetical protein [candidate division Zixibacteria bacterium]
MAFLNEDFAARLEQAPVPSDVVNQLFDSAKEASEERTFLAIIDFEIIVHDGENYLTCEMIRHWMIQQFAVYFSRVLSSIDELDDPDNANVAMRLQMLAYSQFWECLGIQRLLRQLVGIVKGESYQARLFLDEHPSTYSVFKEIRELCDASGLQLVKLLEAIYSNQIRNAFSHSEIWMLPDSVVFQNYDASRENQVPSLRIETWEKLFKVTSDFIVSLFKMRRELETELKLKMPYRVELPEFAGPFNLSKDDRGYWSAQKTK